MGVTDVSDRGKPSRSCDTSMLSQETSSGEERIEENGAGPYRYQNDFTSKGGTLHDAVKV